MIRRDAIKRAAAGVLGFLAAPFVAKATPVPPGPVLRSDDIVTGENYSTRYEEPNVVYFKGNRLVMVPTLGDDKP